MAAAALMADKHPWMKWYPADWRAEPSLRMVSRAARSLWLDLLGLMHESDNRGVLLVRGTVPTLDEIAAILGDKKRDVSQWISELKRAGVFSEIDHNGQPAICSRRMIRDQEKSERNRLNGLNGGNPTLKRKQESIAENSSNGISEPVKPNENRRLKPRSQKPETREPDTSPTKEGEESLIPAREPERAPPEPLVESKPQPPEPSAHLVSAAVKAVCHALEIRLEEDTRRITWPGEVRNMLVEGLNLDRHIEPAALLAKRANKINIRYVLEIARRLRRDEDAARTAGMAVAPAANGRAGEFPTTAPEHTSPAQWEGRMWVQLRNPELWRDAWGPPFGDPGCLAPEDVRAKFEALKAEPIRGSGERRDLH